MPLPQSRAPTDVLVVGSGPNGLAAAVALARAGRQVTVYERCARVGGGVSSAELTLPGYVHDVCSSVYPLAAGSPYFRTLPLEACGLSWRHPEIPVAHPLDDGNAVVLRRSLRDTASELGRDAGAYRRVVGPLADGWWALAEDVLAPPKLPRHPVLALRFAVAGALPAAVLARSAFGTERGRALVGGLAAHAAWPLERPITSAFALILAATGHAVGWPFAAGGAQRLADALARCLTDAGGTIVTDSPVASLADLPPARAILCDLSPRQLVAIAGSTLAPGHRRALRRYRHGPGAFKVDWALSGPIPWAAEACRGAGTVHLGGRFEDIARAEREVFLGRHPERPYVILAQPTIADPSRAPAGRHVAWAYCHVPSGSDVDMTGHIERQVERFAPGFRDLILARHTMAPADFVAHNPNFEGGDITGGPATLRQVLARPTWRHYATPVDGLYLCSAATPPGGGVHGMCGYHAARAVSTYLTHHGGRTGA